MRCRLRTSSVYRLSAQKVKQSEKKNGNVHENKGKTHAHIYAANEMETKWSELRQARISRNMEDEKKDELFFQNKKRKIRNRYCFHA